MQPKYSYTRPKTTSLEKSISPARLSTYGRLSNETTADAIHLYYYNMSLSQSLYIPLQTLEVSLRNIVSNSISTVFGQDWYLQARFKKTLAGWANILLEKAIKKATESTSKKGKLLTEGDVIANLSFGFWGELLAQRYKLSIWNKKFPVAFPNLESTKIQQDVYESVHKIIRLRNRIFHHEPIISQNLPSLYKLTIEIIGWICLDTKDWVECHCDFDEVYSNGRRLCSSHKIKPKLKPAKKKN